MPRQLSFAKKTFIIFTLFWLYVSLFFAQRINLAAVDLGRHLMNGKVILATGNVFATNYYSFTYPEFPAINHHWLYGVVAYLVQQGTSWPGLVLLNVLLSVGAVALAMGQAMLRIARQKKITENSARAVVLISALVTLPLIASRIEVRPEQVSLFFVVSAAILLERIFSKGSTRSRLIACTILLFQQIIWVNMHLFFVLAFALLASHAVRLLVAQFLAHRRQERASAKNQLTLLMLLGLGLIGASLLNPNLLRGLLQPFSIFSAYGYDVVENQGVWFMLKRFGRPREFYVIFYLLLHAALGLGQVLLLKKKQSFLPKFAQELFLFVVFSATALKIIRMYSFLGVVMLPITIVWISRLYPHLRGLGEKLTSARNMSILSPLIFGALALVLSSKLFFPQFSNLGFSLTPIGERSAQFFAENNLPGNIFNNYDIGSYLIYELYPNHRVFVDNRPEAYPVDFFTEEYIPAQENDVKWLEIVEKYNIQTIFFNYSDLTNWSQEFLVARYRDSDWIPIYVDPYAIIFIRNSETNAELIEQFAIPDEFFNVLE